MQWIAPSEKDAANHALEKRLWEAADQLRANSGLNAQQYSGPVLGLIFLRFVEVRFAKQRAALEKQAKGSRRGSRLEDPAAYHADGILFLAPDARFDFLLALPEGANIGSKLNDAMRAIERDNPQLAGVLPKTYELFSSTLLKQLLKRVSEIPASLDYDAFGRIYEYFLGEFARTEGSKGGEFYTPASIVRFIVEVLEPYHGSVFDPASGSGGMFVQSASFVAEHKKNPASELSIHGHEKVGTTVALSRMNLAMHGLEGDIREANSYYDDPHESTGRFDFVLANPPFNVNAVDKERLEGEVGKNRRFPLGLPRTDNANYLWIQLFYSALNKNGRAGFVMANSASDARGSEQEIRRQLIEARSVDVMVAVGPNFSTPSRCPAPFGSWIGRSLKSEIRIPKSAIERTKSSSSTPGTSTGRSTARTATGRPRRSASSPTSSASTAAKRPTSPSAATRRGRSWRKSLAKSRATPTCPASAKPRRSPKSKRKAGRSIPVATSASPRART